MKGQWVEIKPPRCECPEKPSPDPEMHGDGSIWMCNCGAQWRLTWHRNGWGEAVSCVWERVPTAPPI
jgi:hypothetical protein